MTATFRHAALGLALALARGLAAAQATRRSGLWKTIDDSTKKEKSLVRIGESGGVCTGKVEKMLDPDRRRTRSARSAPTTARTSRSSA